MNEVFRLTAASMGVTCLLLLGAAAVFGLAPFGSATVVTDDARIQYIDLFAWLKQVLAGNDSITWSFCRGIGGNVWPVFTYYLTSPLTLLVCLFDRSELYVFYHLLVLLKLSLAAGAMAAYLVLRFHHRIPAYAVVLLSAAYALSEYGVHQSINVMWLDGFYLLPLILLGIWRAGTQQGSACLILSSACAMLFNWYSGCIDLLFAGFFALWEGWIFVRKEGMVRWKPYACFLRRAAFGMLLGVALSAIAFVPTLAGLSGGRASIDWGALRPDYHGHVLSYLTGQLWGSASVNGSVSLYVGAFAFFSAAACFFDRKIPGYWRRYALVLPAFLLLAFYWQPLYFLFSLLKVADSYWYRYSSIGIFLLIYLAGWNASASVRIRMLGEDGHRKALCVLCVASLLDLWGNLGVVMSRFPRDADSYPRYVAAQERQLSAWQRDCAQQPAGRVSQTRTFGMQELRLTANYNEGMATGMRMLSTYTSAPVNAQMRLLDRLGYHQCGPNMNIINTSLVGTDALFGVRTVFADRVISGLRPLEGIPAADGRQAYENPFALPLAFVCKEADLADLPEGDPFQATNAAYARLFGQPVEVYHPVPYEESIEADTARSYHLAAAETQLYGNICGNREDPSNRLAVDDGPQLGYLCWLAPSVFDIPQGSGEHTVRLTSQCPLPELHPQFYRVDEAALQHASDLAWARAADVTLGQDTATIRVAGHAGEKLFTSLPWDKGWKALQNGRDVRPEPVADALMGFTLDEGENEIILQYELPGWKKGAGITLLALVASIALLYRERKRDRRW